ncbi:hypothetical protein MTO96_007506 [Rhipicephalus appendiculatus]
MAPFGVGEPVQLEALRRRTRKEWKEKRSNTSGLPSLARSRRPPRSAFSAVPGPASGTPGDVYDVVLAALRPLSGSFSTAVVVPMAAAVSRPHPPFLRLVLLYWRGTSPVGENPSRAYSNACGCCRRC